MLVHRVEAGQHLVNCSGPTATIVNRPIAESIEYRPPTQSQNSNMFAVSIPNSATRSAFVETATKCLAIAAGSPSWPSTQSRAEVAFVNVSRVRTSWTKR